MRAILFLWILQVLIFAPLLNAQNGAQDSLVPYSLTSSQWNQVQKRWTRKNIDATLYLVDSTECAGQILAVNDSTVMFWKGEGFYSDGAADSMSIEIPLEDVDSVHVYGRFLHPHGGLKGLLVGGGIGLVASTGLFIAGQGYISPLIGVAPLVLGLSIGYPTGKTHAHKRHEKRIANSSMREYAVFPAGIPARKNIDSIAKKSPQINCVFPAKLIYFNAYAGAPQVPFRFTGSDDLTGTYGGGIGFIISPHWSTEVHGSYLALEGYIPADGQLVRRNVKWRNAHVTANFSVVKNGRLTDRWYQLTFGGGYTYSSVVNAGFTYVALYNFSDGASFAFTKGLHGFHLQAKAQVFTGSCFSFFCMGNTVFLPTITLPECKVMNPATGEPVGMDQVTAHYSWLAINAGIQFYFRRN